LTAAYGFYRYCLSTPALRVPQARRRLRCHLPLTLGVKLAARRADVEVISDNQRPAALSVA
jgi:hypothetical protein